MPAAPAAAGSCPERIAVVIPTLDEEEALERLLPELSGWADEIVVSDGGSVDGTVATARAHGVRVVAGEAGRGRQLDLGARATTAPVLLFAHADSRLPPAARERILTAVAEGHVGGGFRLRFEGDSLLPRLGSRLVNLRTGITGCPLGDQGQFCTREAYERLGGFAHWPILEDVDLSRRLKRLGRIALLHEEITTSYRRYQSGGVLRTVATNWLIWALYFAGVSPRRLGTFYGKIR